MLTLREARQRLSLINARIQFDKDYGEYRVTLQEWPLCARRTEEKAYYTNDLEDALFTAQDMRREANFYGRARYLPSSETTLLGMCQPEKRYAFR
jgi:curved DNA-binding protein CbpA